MLNANERTPLRSNEQQENALHMEFPSMDDAVDRNNQDDDENEDGLEFMAHHESQRRHQGAWEDEQGTEPHPGVMRHQSFQDWSNVERFKMRAVRLASIYVKAALYDRQIDHKTDDRSLDFVEFYYESWFFQILVNLAILGFLVITFFEDRDDATMDERRYVFGSEALCWLMMMSAFYIRYRFTEWDRLLTSRFVRIHVVCLVVTFVDMVYAFYRTETGDPYYRYARMIRPALVLEYNPPIRRLLIDIIRTCIRVRAALMLMLFHITFFAVISMFLFYESEEGTMYFSSLGDSMVTLIILMSTCNSPSAYLPAYKANKFSALYFVLFLVLSVYVLLNLVLTVVYGEHRNHLKREAKRLAVRKRVCTSAAYRTLFRFVQNTRIAPRVGGPHASIRYLTSTPTVSRSAYKSGIPKVLVKELLMRLGLRKDQSKTFADVLASGPGNKDPEYVSRDDFEDIILIVHFTEQKKVHNSSDSDSDSELDDLLEDDSDLDEELSPQLLTGSINNREPAGSYFRHESFVVDYRVRFDPETDGEDVSLGWFQHCGKTRKTRSEGFKRFAIRAVMHHSYLGQHIGYVRTLDFAVNFLLISAAILTIALLSWDPKNILNDPFEIVLFNAICSIFFGFEIFLRIYATSIKHYFEHGWNVFDFTIVSLSLLGVLGSEFSWNFFTSNHHLFLFIRKLRLLRLLKSIPQFRMLTELAVYLIPALLVFARVISVFYYMYAILGMGAFRHIRLPDEEFQVNDFSSFGNSLLTLFELMVINDWNKTMYSFAHATNSWAYLYFIFWYFFVAVVVINIITSFALEGLDKKVARSELFHNTTPSSTPVPISAQYQQHEPMLKPQTPPTNMLHVQLRQQEGGSSSAASSPAFFQGQAINTHSPSDALFKQFQASNRELTRGMTFVDRVHSIEKFGEIIKEKPLVRLLEDVFNKEVDEPTLLEIDQELDRLGLEELSNIVV